MQASRTGRQIEYNLHGFAGIRLVDASAQEIDAVTKQLGPIQAPLSGDPDITIRFVDRLELSSTVRYIGLDDAAFTDGAFLVLRGQHKSNVQVQIPFETIGQQCEIVCARGLAAVPLLIPIINLTALCKGILPLHASAFSYQGNVILVTGWSKSGKTEALLAFSEKGAEYIGDEWIYLDRDHKCVYGIPEPVRLWNWHMQDQPQLRSMIKGRDRTRLWVLELFLRFLDGISNGRPSKGTKPLRWIERLKPLIKGQLNVQIPPEKLFGQKPIQHSAIPGKVFFLASHASSEISVKPIDPAEIAKRMVFSLQHERFDLIAYYLKFRFAFPERTNPLIEQAEEIQRDLLSRILAGKEAYAVYHPYPVSISALYEAMEPFAGDRR